MTCVKKSQSWLRGLRGQPCFEAYLSTRASQTEINRTLEEGASSAIPATRWRFLATRKPVSGSGRAKATEAASLLVRCRSVQEPPQVSANASSFTAATALAVEMVQLCDQRAYQRVAHSSIYRILCGGDNLRVKKKTRNCGTSIPRAADNHGVCVADLRRSVKSTQVIWR